MVDGGSCSEQEQGAQVVVATPQASPVPEAAAAASTALALQPLAPLAPLPDSLGGVTLATHTTITPPPPLSSLPQLFGEDCTSLLELSRRAGSAEAGIVELYQALHSTRQEGNRAFNELGKYLVKVEEVHEEKMKLFDQHVAGGISSLNTVLHSHHDRHHQVEERLAYLLHTSQQLATEQQQAGIRLANVMRMEMQHHMDSFGAQVARLEERLDRHIAAQQLPPPGQDAQYSALVTATSAEIHQLQHRLTQLESSSTTTHAQVVRLEGVATATCA